jgi:hypothetical protein
MVKKVLVDIPDTKRPLSIDKEKVLKRIKRAVKEMNMVNAGKLKTRDARSLVNEL